MKRLIDEGYLYIAQPPLYRVGRGRSASYRYSEEEKDKWVLETSLRNVEISSTDGKVKMGGKDLIQAFSSLRTLERSMDSLEEMGLARDTTKALLKKSAAVQISFDALGEPQDSQSWFSELLGAKTNIQYDPDEGEARLVIEDGEQKIDARKILESPLLSRCIEMYPQVQELVEGDTYVVVRGERELATDVPWDRLAAELEKAQDTSGITLQRYKGLGEMNPDQLWETTMNPKKRTLLNVNLEEVHQDTVEDIFVRLMGEEVAPRKSFILAHARSVRNLDV
jgi:DNA gyrase subunit B